MCFLYFRVHWSSSKHATSTPFSAGCKRILNSRSNTACHLPAPSSIAAPAAVGIVVVVAMVIGVLVPLVGCVTCCVKQHRREKQRRKDTYLSRAASHKAQVRSMAVRDAGLHVGLGWVGLGRTAYAACCVRAHETCFLRVDGKYDENGHPNVILSHNRISPTLGWVSVHPVARAALLYRSKCVNT